MGGGGGIEQFFVFWAASQSCQKFQAKQQQE